MSAANTQEPVVIIAAADILFASRTLTTLADGGSLSPLDRALVQLVIDALARNEVMTSVIISGSTTPTTVVIGGQADPRTCKHDRAWGTFNGQTVCAECGYVIPMVEPST